MGTHSHILLHYLIVVFHTVGIGLAEPGEPLHFHFSLTTFLQGKQRPTNHVKPQEKIEKENLAT